MTRTSSAAVDAPLPTLTAGLVDQLLSNGTSAEEADFEEDPVVQLLDVQPPADDDEESRWRASVSDGVHLAPAVLPKLATSNECVRLTDWSVEDVDGVRTLCIGAVENVAAALPTPIGTPVKWGVEPTDEVAVTAAPTNPYEGMMRPVWKNEKDFPQLLSYHLPLHRTLAALLQVSLQRQDETTLQVLDITAEQACSQLTSLPLTLDPAHLPQRLLLAIGTRSSSLSPALCSSSTGVSSG